MTTQRTRKQKPKIRTPVGLPEPVTVRLKPSSYQPREAEMEEMVKIDATPKQVARAVLRPVKIIENSDA